MLRLKQLITLKAKVDNLVNFAKSFSLILVTIGNECGSCRGFMPGGIFFSNFVFKYFYT